MCHPHGHSRNCVPLDLPALQHTGLIQRTTMMTPNSSNASHCVSLTGLQCARQFTASSCTAQTLQPAPPAPPASPRIRALRAMHQLQPPRPAAAQRRHLPLEVLALAQELDPALTTHSTKRNQPPSRSHRPQRSWLPQRQPCKWRLGPCLELVGWTRCAQPPCHLAAAHVAVLPTLTRSWPKPPRAALPPCDAQSTAALSGQQHQGQ